MATMKAIDIKDDKGPIENMFINEIPRPTLKSAQALVKIKAFGLNRYVFFMSSRTLNPALHCH